MKIKFSAAAILFGLAPLMLGQEPSQPAQALRRQAAYRGLFPFYSFEAFEDGSTRHSALAGAVRVNSEPNGDFHHHVLPFYCTSLSEGGADRELSLYPLLYLGERRPSRDSDFVLPLFYRWREDRSRHTLLWPLFHAASDPEETPFRAIPTLFRHGRWAEESRQRLGVPIFLELFERARSSDSSGFTFLNFFNFYPETESGLPVGMLSLKADGYHAHFFPLFFTGRKLLPPREKAEGISEPEEEAGDESREERYFYTPLIGLSSEDEGKSTLAFPALLSGGSWWEDGHDVMVLSFLAGFHRDGASYDNFVFPFYFEGGAEPPAPQYRFYSFLYGRVDRPDSRRSDRFLPLFLSHYGARADGFAVNVLWPLGHYSESEDEYAIRALPFFDRRRASETDRWGLGGILYRRHQDFGSDTDSHWLLWPLWHWKLSRQELVAWAVPAFYHRDEERGTSHRVRTTWVLPTFLSHAEEDLRPLDGEWVETRGWLHLWPLFGRFREGSMDGLNSSATYSTLYPFFRLERSSREQSGAASSLHAPWPLNLYHTSQDSLQLRLALLFNLGREGGRRYGYLYPLAAVEAGQRDNRRISNGGGFFHSTSIFQWYDDGEERTFNWFPLIFQYHGIAATTRVRGPLWWFYYRSSPQDGWFHLLPLGFGRWSEADSSVGVFPLYYRRDFGSDEINLWTPARFFYLWNSLANASESHQSFLWKAVEHSSAALAAAAGLDPNCRRGSFDNIPKSDLLADEAWKSYSIRFSFSLSRMVRFQSLLFHDVHLFKPAFIMI